MGIFSYDRAKVGILHDSFPYLDLLVGPTIHAQRLDLRDVCAQLAMDCGASHAQKHAQLKSY